MNQNSHSHVLPDENWFYYWRTSASLWEGILDENPSLDEIWILVNWGGHFSTIDKIDFGETRPELDFFRLALLCRKKNRNVKFFFSSWSFSNSGKWRNPLTSLHRARKDFSVFSSNIFRLSIKYFTPFYFSNVNFIFL